MQRLFSYLDVFSQLSLPTAKGQRGERDWGGAGGDRASDPRGLLNVRQLEQPIVLGFVPAVLLMYFNTNIYLDIRWVIITFFLSIFVRGPISKESLELMRHFFA